jgi:uncharacterized protein YjbI with pentapeptide repeats
LLDKRIWDNKALSPKWLNSGWDTNISMTVLKDSVITDSVLDTQFLVFRKKNINTFPFYLGGNKAKFDSTRNSSMYVVFYKEQRRAVVSKNTSLVIESYSPEVSTNLRCQLEKHSQWLSGIKEGIRLGSDTNDLKFLNKNYKLNTREDTLRHFLISGGDFRDADIAYKYITANDTITFCNFNKALLTHSKLRAYVAMCDFRNAQLNQTQFNSSTLVKCNFSGADLTEVSFKNTRIMDCDFSSSIFEPMSLPSVDSLIGCKGLDDLIFEGNPSKGYLLAKQFKDAGMRTQYLDVIYSLNKYKTHQYTFTPLRWLRTLLFDYTCRYGKSTMRLMLILLVSFILFSTIYYRMLISITTKQGKKITSPVKSILKGFVYSIVFIFRFNKSFINDMLKDVVKLENDPFYSRGIVIISYIQSFISIYLISLLLAILINNPFENFLL